MSNDTTDTTTITVPAVSGTDAAEATDRIEELIDKYKMANKDVDALFNAIVAVYVRGRMIYGDRQPEMCSLAACLDQPTEPEAKAPPRAAAPPAEGSD